MNKNQAEARAKAVKTLERALTDRNKTIKELRKEVADLTSKLDLLHQEFCDKGPPKQTPIVFKNAPHCSAHEQQAASRLHAGRRRR